MAKRRKSSSATTHLLSLAAGLGIPAAFTFIYTRTLDFAPLWVWVITINLTLLALMGKDKLAAKQQWSRTPEFTLLLLTFLGATPGIFLGRYLFHHKTSKETFQYALFGTLAVQAACVWYLWPQLRQWL